MRWSPTRTRWWESAAARDHVRVRLRVVVEAADHRIQKSGGWSAKLADTRLDDAVRYENIAEDKVYGVSTPRSMIEILNEKIGLYSLRHQGIR